MDRGDPLAVALAIARAAQALAIALQLQVDELGVLGFQLAQAARTRTAERDEAQEIAQALLDRLWSNGDDLADMVLPSWLDDPRESLTDEDTET